LGLTNAELGWLFAYVFILGRLEPIADPSPA
jgi:hypothetical protein